MSLPCWSPSARTEPLHVPSRLACWVWILSFPRKGKAKAFRAAFFLFNIKQWQLVTSGFCSVSKGLTPGRGGGWLFCRRPGCPRVVCGDHWRDRQVTAGADPLLCQSVASSALSFPGPP